MAERHGQPVGFAGAGGSRDPVRPGLGELDTIAVDPPHWRTGVGGALMVVALADLAVRFREAFPWTGPPAGSLTVAPGPGAARCHSGMGSERGERRWRSR